MNRQDIIDQLIIIKREQEFHQTAETAEAYRRRLDQAQHHWARMIDLIYQFQDLRRQLNPPNFSPEEYRRIYLQTFPDPA
jgi:hypothetical protein